MPNTVKNKNSYKIVPFASAGFTAEIIAKLNRGAKREEIGQLVDYRTPFASHKAGKASFVPKNTRISGVKGRIAPDRASLVEKFYATVVLPTIKNPDYIAGEDKFMAYRFSSRSVRLPFSEIFESAVVPYFSNAQSEFEPEVGDALMLGLNDGKKRLRTKIPARSLRLLSFELAADELPSTTNGGAPYFIPGKELIPGTDQYKDNRGKYIELAKKLSKEELTEELILQNSFWSIGRGQESNDTKDRYRGIIKPKQRRPGAEGHAGTIMGARMKPFLDIRAKDPMRAALVNQRAVDEVISLNGKRIQTNDGMVSGDGSSYDTHMIPKLALEIANVIIESFALNGEDYECCRRYFYHMFHDPLITPYGIMQGTHGMPSGTTFTNELDSCYNEVLAFSFKYLPSQYKKHESVELIPITDQGDDMVLSFHSSVRFNPEEVSEILSQGYGAMNMSVNPKKQMVSQHKCEYLKRLHTKGIKESYRSYVWTLIGMLNMEHAKDGQGAMYSARWIMQAANHYSNLPGFDQFMEFVVSGDAELRIGVGIKGGAMKVLQMAGGTDSVIKRLGYASYTTHLGVDVKDGRASIADLSSAQWVAVKNEGLHR